MLAVGVMLLAATAPAEAVRPARIVSLNLCADAFLIALADRDQIAALTPSARDPGLSDVVALAADLPITDGSAEAVLALRPDLILASTYGRREARLLLARPGVTALELPPAESFAQIVDQIRVIAEAVGHPQRGEALIAAMEADLARVPGPPDGARPTVVHWQRRGFVSGAGTLMDEILTRAGLDNLGRTLARGPIDRIDLERLVHTRPDFVLVETADPVRPDLGARLVMHPAIDRFLKPGHRLALPQSATICGGPGFARAVTTLAERVAAATGR